MYKRQVGVLTTFLLYPRQFFELHTFQSASSSLYAPSERLVQRALGTIPADRTAVIITHRLSTVEIADWVLVLEHSQILENGSPAELEAQGGRYVGLHKPGRSHLPDGDVSEAHPESRRRD